MLPRACLKDFNKNAPIIRRGASLRPSERVAPKNGSLWPQLATMFVAHELTVSTDNDERLDALA